MFIIQSPSGKQRDSKIRIIQRQVVYEGTQAQILRQGVGEVQGLRAAHTERLPPGVGRITTPAPTFTSIPRNLRTRLADVNMVRVKMRLYWIRIGPPSNDSVLVRDRRGHVET